MTSSVFFPLKFNICLEEDCVENKHLISVTVDGFKLSFCLIANSWSGSAVNMDYLLLKKQNQHRVKQKEKKQNP